MTNADVIRSMTDKQLDEFLAQFEFGDIDYAVTFCDWCKEDGNELGLDCDGCRTHWLTEDANSYNGLNGWLRHNGFEPYREDGERGGSPMTHDIIWTIILAATVGIGMAILCQ